MAFEGRQILNRVAALPQRVVLALIVINVLVFLFCLAAEVGRAQGWWEVSPAQWLGVPGTFPLPVDRLWTPLTYMVTQTDFLHLLFNMLWLWCFGEALSAAAGNRKMLVIYVGSGLSGALFYVISTAIWSGGGMLVGASASVLGMMTAAAMLSPDKRFHIFPLRNVKLKWIALAGLLLAFLGTGGGGYGPGSAAAHLGGVVFSAGAGYYLRRRVSRRVTHPRLRESVAPQMAPRFDSRRLSRLGRPTPEDYRRLDALLDKIRLSGFDSLSQVEKNELSFLSRKLNK